MSNNDTLVVVSSGDLTQLIEQFVDKAIQEAFSRYGVDNHIQKQTASNALSFDEVRLRLKLSAPSVRKLIRSGKLRAVQAGRRWLVPNSEIERFLGVDSSQRTNASEFQQ